jgi:hypothetical protein
VLFVFSVVKDFVVYLMALIITQGWMLVKVKFQPLLFSEIKTGRGDFFFVAVFSSLPHLYDNCNTPWPDKRRTKVSMDVNWIEWPVFKRIHDALITRDVP